MAITKTLLKTEVDKSLGKRETTTTLPCCLRTGERWRKVEVSLCKGKLKHKVFLCTESQGRLVLWRYFKAVIASLQLFPKLFPNYTTEGKVERKDKRFHELCVDPSWLLSAFNCPGW